MNLKKIRTVLLDDDKFIRLNWDLEFKKQNLLLDTFASPRELLEKLSFYDDNTVFILDTCGFGADFHELLEKVKKNQSYRYYIFSGYQKEKFTKLSIPLENVLPKDFDLISVPKALCT